jgi:hypothetical protein
LNSPRTTTVITLLILLTACGRPSVPATPPSAGDGDAPLRDRDKVVNVYMLAIPADAPHPGNAEIWMNYLMRADVIIHAW